MAARNSLFRGSRYCASSETRMSNTRQFRTDRSDGLNRRLFGIFGQSNRPYRSRCSQ